MKKRNAQWNERGSQWHRWDPHLHAPGTLLNDQFKGNWDQYLQFIENSNPKIQALGVTDYYCIETYKKVCEEKKKGRLPNVELIFPNVEMRLNIQTKDGKGVNIHLLFSPEENNHEQEIERILKYFTFKYNDRNYNCTVDEFERLGRIIDPNQTDKKGMIRVGVNQFKIELKTLENLFNSEKWLQKNCLVAVAGGSDGTSGLKNSSFSATRTNIEKFSNIIFTSSPKQIKFWLGKLEEYPKDVIESKYGSLKPCLHGSDAHQLDMIGKPENNRYTWIKGDLRFETLHQVIIRVVATREDSVIR